MVSSARAAVGQNPVGQPAGQVESGEVVDPQLGSNTGLNISNTGLNIPNTGLNISNTGLNIEQALCAAFMELPTEVKEEYLRKAVLFMQEAKERASSSDDQ